MRTVLLCSLLGLAVGCLPEDEERCYNADDTDRPGESHLVFDEASGTCVRVDGGSEKDAAMDRDVPDEAVPECSAENACTDPRSARCNQGTCEKCSDHSHCTQFPNTPICSNGRCNQCATNVQCTSPGAPKCFAGSCTKCEVDNDCSLIDGKNVCNDAGTCVECTAEKDAACTGVCVIEPLTEAQKAFSCDNSLTEKAGDCEPCVASKHCQNGRACVPLSSGETDLGNFCQWILAEAPEQSCAEILPYSKVLELTPIEGGDAEAFCTLRLSTCQALNHFSDQDCMSLDEDGNARCGAAEVDDGYCIQREGFGPRCTVPCGDVEEDCPTEASSCMTVEDRLDIGAQKVCLF